MFNPSATFFSPQIRFLKTSLERLSSVAITRKTARVYLKSSNSNHGIVSIEKYFLIATVRGFTFNNLILIQLPTLAAQKNMSASEDLNTLKKSARLEFSKQERTINVQEIFRETALHLWRLLADGGASVKA